MIYNSYEDFIKDLQPSPKTPKKKTHAVAKCEQDLKQWHELVNKFFRNQQEIKNK